MIVGFFFGLFFCMFWLKHLETLPELSLSLFVLFTVSTTACFVSPAMVTKKKREKTGERALADRADTFLSPREQDVTGRLQYANFPVCVYVKRYFRWALLEPCFFMLKLVCRVTYYC